MSARRGFQVAELVVAGSVFLLATLPVITLFLERGRAHRQGPDHALALGLAFGAVEELAASAADDPRVLENLALDPVAPRLWPASEAESPLGRELAGLSGKLASRPRGAGTTCAITDFSLTVDWSWGGEERELTLAFALSAAHAARLVHPLPVDAAIARAGGARSHWEAARRQEARAAARLAALEQLARTPPAPAALEAATGLKPALVADLASALDGYERVAADESAPPRIRRGSRRRAGEVASLLALLGDAPRPGVSTTLAARANPDRARAIQTYDRVMMSRGSR